MLTDDGVIAVARVTWWASWPPSTRRGTRNATVVAETALEVLVYDVATYRSLARDAELGPLASSARLGPDRRRRRSSGPVRRPP